MAKCPFGNEYDPTGEETFDGIYERFAELRRSCPVAHSEAFEGFSAFSRYDDVLMALDDPENFNYLNQSGCISIDGTDDAKDFHENMV